MDNQKPFAHLSFAMFVSTMATIVPGVAFGATPAISMSQARSIALATFHGSIVKAELEHERGGSGLRYSFDMKNGKIWHEVGVDAITGRVLENSYEGANPKD